MRETRLEFAPGWTAVYVTGADRGGGPAMVGLRIEPTSPDVVPEGGLTATLLRQVPMGRVVAQSYEELAEPPLTYAELAQQADTYSDLDSAPQRGRKHSDKFLLEVAEAWDLVLRTASAGDIYEGLIAELRKRGHEYGRDGAVSLIRKARARGFLIKPTSRGRLGGGLTPRAQRLLGR